MQLPSYNPILFDVHSLPLRKASCRHDLLPNGVQELTLGAVSQNTVTEWVRSLDTVVRQASSGRPLRVLTDAGRSVLPPLAYVSHIAALMMQHPYSIPGGRYAILHDSGPLSAVAQTIADSLLCGGEQIRFFAPHQRADALRWLGS